MPRPSRPPSVRPVLAALAAALLSTTVASEARASQEDCFVELPGAPGSGTGPGARRKAAPVPAPKPTLRVGAEHPSATQRSDPAPATGPTPASMRKVPIECAPKPVRELRAGTPATLADDPRQASAGGPGRPPADRPDAGTGLPRAGDPG